MSEIFSHLLIPLWLCTYANLKLDIYFKIVMNIWWQRIWNTDLQQQHQSRQISITENVPTKRRQSRIMNRCRTTTSTTTTSTITTTHTSQQMPYSIHNCTSRQSKCIRVSSTEQSVRMKSFCSVIILIHCFNVLVLSIASEQSTTIQPCDRTRRVFTDAQGEISNGPFGSNYTQVSITFFFSSLISFHFVSYSICCYLNSFKFHSANMCTCVRCSYKMDVVAFVWSDCERVWACMFLVGFISNSIYWAFCSNFFFIITKRQRKKMNKNKIVMRLNHANWMYQLC